MKIALLVPRGISDFSEYDSSRAQKFVSGFEALGLECPIVQVVTPRNLEAELETLHPDLVFPLAYQIMDENRREVPVHSLLERLQYAYIGSHPESLALVRNKSALKDRWRENKVTTPGSVTIRREEGGILQGLRLLDDLEHYPYLIKPNGDCEHMAIHEEDIADTYPMLQYIIKQRINECSTLLVEEYLGDDPEIREFSLALLGSGERQVISPGEVHLLIPQNRRMITASDKDPHRTRIIPVENRLRDGLLEFSTAAFKAAQIIDYGRLDVLYAHHEFFALEIEGQPNVFDRWFRDCLSLAGFSSHQYLAYLVTASISRWEEVGYSFPALPSGLCEMSGAVGFGNTINSEIG